MADVLGTDLCTSTDRAWRVLGKRWSGLIIDLLLQGPARFSELERGVEGLMLKRRDSPYIAGRKVGLWYKWKRDPLVADCVMMYAQRGNGRRSSFYSDYTFGCWTEDGELLSWHTLNPQPVSEAPVLRFDKGSALTFPKDSLLGFDQLAAALLEAGFHSSPQGIRKRR